MKIRSYKKDSDYSYTYGAFATIELLKLRPSQVLRVFVHSDYKDSDNPAKLCEANAVELVLDDRVFKRLGHKENIYVLGVFSKYKSALSPLRPHVVLVNPMDMGNLGTIMRILAGFNILDLAIITPAADYFNPKTIRASMGALFNLEIELFPSFEIYREKFFSHDLYPFMLDGEIELGKDPAPKSSLYSLIFGNEATGLPSYFKGIGTSVKLHQSNLVDSLNLSVAVGIGAYLFAIAGD